MEEKNYESLTSHKGAKVQKYSITTKLEAVKLAKKTSNEHAARKYKVDTKRILLI
jgi:hypothetical protein